MARYWDDFTSYATGNLTNEKPQATTPDKVSKYVDDTVLTDDLVALADDPEALAGSLTYAGDRPDGLLIERTPQ